MSLIFCPGFHLPDILQCFSEKDWLVKGIFRGIYQKPFGQAAKFESFCRKKSIIV
jgi:hypothetical protein